MKRQGQTKGYEARNLMKCWGKPTGNGHRIIQGIQYRYTIFKYNSLYTILKNNRLYTVYNNPGK